MIKKSYGLEKIDVIIEYNKLAHVFGRNIKLSKRNIKLSECYYIILDDLTGDILHEQIYNKITDYYNKIGEVEEEIDKQANDVLAIISLLP